MPIILPQGLQITGKQAVDSRLLLSKEAMREINDNVMPIKYFSICVDDGLIYLYSKDNTVDPELGRFRLANKQLETDLETALEEIAELNNKKEDTDNSKISSFFIEHPDFEYRFLISIANQPVTDVADYIELIYKEYEDHFPAALVPFDVGVMGVIVKVFSNTSGESFRIYIPKTGQIVSISLVDASGLVKFAYSTIGDGGDTAKWGQISGNIKDQEDLGNDFLASDNYISRTEIENLFG